MNKKAVVFLSGGADSATCLAVAKASGYTCYALTFDYGQRHSIEIDYARRFAAQQGVAEHRIFKIDLAQWGGSALTDGDMDVPEVRSHNIPSTYVPARNTIFLSLALGWAETLGAAHIFFGANLDDKQNYPDCRPDYINAFEATANLATRAGVEGQRLTIHAPFIDMTKADIFREGVALGIDYNDTFSCYNPSPEGQRCGRCDACYFRHQGLKAAGIL